MNSLTKTVGASRPHYRPRIRPRIEPVDGLSISTKQVVDDWGDIPTHAAIHSALSVTENLCGKDLCEARDDTVWVQGMPFPVQLGNTLKLILEDSPDLEIHPVLTVYGTVYGEVSTSYGPQGSRLVGEVYLLFPGTFFYAAHIKTAGHSRDALVFLTTPRVSKQEGGWGKFHETNTLRSSDPNRIAREFARYGLPVMSYELLDGLSAESYGEQTESSLLDEFKRQVNGTTRMYMNSNDVKYAMACVELAERGVMLPDYAAENMLNQNLSTYYHKAKEAIAVTNGKKPVLVCKNESGGWWLKREGKDEPTVFVSDEELEGPDLNEIVGCMAVLQIGKRRQMEPGVGICVTPYIYTVQVSLETINEIDRRLQEQTRPHGTVYTQQYS